MNLGRKILESGLTIHTNGRRPVPGRFGRSRGWLIMKDVETQSPYEDREHIIPGRVVKRRAKMVIAATIIVIVVFGVLVFTMPRSPPDRPRTPVSDLFRVYSNPPFHEVPLYSVEYTFGGFTRYLYWSDLQITLNDSAHRAVWFPNTSGLSGGTITSYSCGQNPLANMSVTCNITDFLGNGIPNAGDRITLTTGSDVTFLPTQFYTVTISYLPLKEPICSATFNGTG